MKSIPVFILSVFTMVAVCQGEHPRLERLTDFRTQIVGTTWKVGPGQSQRPGLAAELTFSSEQVEPEGYRYQTKTGNSLTVFFNHGDSQAMNLSADGKHLKFTFRQKQYSYELVAEDDKDDGKLRAQLAGSKWNAVPMTPTRPGLAGVLSFTEETVGPAGYKYDVNAEDSITIHFNHGDTQLMVLSGEGNRLTAIFKDQKYEYERAAE
jgi:hypothetical protein